MDHTSHATLSSFIHPHTLYIHVLIVWSISKGEGYYDTAVRTRYVLPVTSPVSHLTQTSFTTHSVQYTQYTLSLHISSYHSFTLCWCFTLVVNHLLTTIAHHISCCFLRSDVSSRNSLINELGDEKSDLKKQHESHIAEEESAARERETVIADLWSVLDLWLSKDWAEDVMCDCS